MIYTSTATTERPRIDVQLSSSSSTRILRKIQHSFMCGGIPPKLKIGLNSAAPHRRSSSSSGLLKREDCFILPRAYQVRRPLSRYLARSTVRARSPISRFQARSSYSYHYHCHAVRRKRHTTVFYAITRKASSINYFLAMHMKNVPRLFLCWHT